MKNTLVKLSAIGVATLGSLSCFAETAVSKTPIEQVTQLFDLQPLIVFFISAAGAIISFAMGKKAFGMVRSWIKRA